MSAKKSFIFSFSIPFIFSFLYISSEIWKFFWKSDIAVMARDSVLSLIYGLTGSIFFLQGCHFSEWNLDTLCILILKIDWIRLSRVISHFSISEFHHFIISRRLQDELKIEDSGVETILGYMGPTRRIVVVVLLVLLRLLQFPPPCHYHQGPSTIHMAHVAHVEFPS